MPDPSGRLASATLPKETGKRRWLHLGIALVVLAVVLLVLVSSPEVTNDTGELAQAPPPDARTGGMLLNSVMASLDRLEEFNTEPLLIQTVERLNQWLRGQQQDTAWKPSPLLSTLPDDLQQLPIVKRLRDWRFNAYDANHLLEVVSCRNISNQARGEQIDDLTRAVRLFDWTVRNLQLESGSSAGALHLPRQVLQTGHARLWERAWCFILLARQQGLNAVVLAHPAHDLPDGYQPWAVGVLIDNALYLFEPELGLPIPGPDGKGIATLAEAAADDRVLRQLDLDAEHTYPLDPAEITACRALIEASPDYLSQRMQAVETHLTGEERLRLTVDADGLAERLRSMPHVADVALWALPYRQFAEAIRPESVQSAIREMVRYRPDLLPRQPRDFQTPIVALQQGRAWHLKGKFVGEAREPSANAYYQMARPADVDVDAAELSLEQRETLLVTKQDATYWLGLVAQEREAWDVAIAYFKDRTLGTWPKGPWTNGARYNLGRCYEAQGQFDDAQRWYEADTSPQRAGNLLRLRLARQAAGLDAAASADQPAATDERSEAPAEPGDVATP